MPADLEVEDPRQSAFLERLRADAATHEGADLLETSLESLKTAIGEVLHPPERSSARKTVFVARTGFDLHEQHEALVRSLEADGHEVLPDKPLPLFAEGLTVYLREALSRCDLSVHLVGERYAMVPEGSTRSVVELQDEVAAELGGSSRLAPRRAWTSRLSSRRPGWRSSPSRAARGCQSFPTSAWASRRLSPSGSRTRTVC